MLQVSVDKTHIAKSGQYRETERKREGGEREREREREEMVFRAEWCRMFFLFSFLYFLCVFFVVWVSFFKTKKKNRSSVRV